MPVRLPTFQPGPVQDRNELEPATARLVDTWRKPSRREKFHSALDSAFSQTGPGQLEADQLIVGGGVHGAIYAATAQARTGVAPLVAEARRTGGVYALSDTPVFYLNSRNRPGELGLPGTRGALNVVPNSIIQPSDLDGAEYQTNAHMSFVIRAALAMYANVAKASVAYIAANVTAPRNRAYFALSSNHRVEFRCDRIILATGLGPPRITKSEFPSDVVMTFEDFVTRVGNTSFPLAGWRNVAVLGAQDSGDAVVKFLLGQGPGVLGPASLDAVERIDWYGQDCRTKEDFEANARSCNSGIGRHLPRGSDPTYPFTVYAIPHRGESVVSDRREGARIIYGSDRRISDPYDHVVVCTGYEGSAITVNTDVDKTLGPSDTLLPLREEIVYDDDGTALARRYVGTEIYKAGACADLPVTNTERQRAPALDRIPANSAAIFRYAYRTRRLAEILNPA